MRSRAEGGGGREVRGALEDAGRGGEQPTCFVTREAIRNHPKPSEAIRSHPEPPEAIGSHREPSGAIGSVSPGELASSPCFVTSRFSGLMSRCTMPCMCRYLQQCRQRQDEEGRARAGAGTRVHAQTGARSQLWLRPVERGVFDQAQATYSSPITRCRRCDQIVASSSGMGRPSASLFWEEPPSTNSSTMKTSSHAGSRITS